MKGPPHTNMINGRPVVNATRKVLLHISAADAKKGNVKDPGACAAALAAIRAVPDTIAARIHLGRAYLLNKKTNKWMRYKTPDALRSEIVAFDRGGSFEPGDYELRPLSPSDSEPRRPGLKFARDPDRGGKGANKTKHPRKLHVVRGVRQHGANR